MTPHEMTIDEAIATIKRMQQQNATEEVSGEADLSLWLLNEPPRASPAYMEKLAGMFALADDIWHAGSAAYALDLGTQIDAVEVTEGPEVPPPVWDDRPIDADRAMAAVRALSGG
jgi:hypothetical protein